MKLKLPVFTTKSLFAPQPLRDWVTLLCFGLGALILIFGLSFSSFMRVRDGNIVGASAGDASGIARISRDDLERVVTTLEARRTAFEKNTVAAPSLKDPSR